METIGIIEDDELLGQALAIALRKEGYETLSAVNCREGRGLLEKKSGSAADRHQPARRRRDQLLPRYAQIPGDPGDLPHRAGRRGGHAGGLHRRGGRLRGKTISHACADQTDTGRFVPMQGKEGGFFV